MTKLTIFEDQNGPRSAPNALATRLFVSHLKRSEDNRAITLFHELAEVLGRAGFTDKEQVLSLVQVQGAEPEVLKQLPRLVNGTVYTGVDAIESYVISCREGYGTERARA